MPRSIVLWLFPLLLLLIAGSSHSGDGREEGGVNREAREAAARGPGSPDLLFTYPDLVRRMIDLEALARLPEPGEKGALWSSRDRRSRYDEGAGGYAGWGANDDWGGSLGEANGRTLLGEMSGPGCIWRIWSASPGDGRVRVFVDGGSVPVMDRPFRDYFRYYSGPPGLPSLSYSLESQGSRGYNLYYPIPYRTSCRIEADRWWGVYYQISYSTFPAGTVPPAFTGEHAIEDRIALGSLDRYLRTGLGTDPAGPRPGLEVESGEVSVPPGRSVPLAALAGPRAITAVRMTFPGIDPAGITDLLQRVVLTIRWDSEESPAVWCPLGDFFGATPGLHPYHSLVTGMDEGGCYALWYMPFGESARVEVLNEDGVEHAIAFEIEHAPLSEPVGGLGRFHCKWHRGLGAVPKNRWPDWTFLRTRSRGRYCGLVLHVWNPYGEWWGEGDEKFFVDGETMPSTFGTGTEDYFGYAWGDSNTFAMPFHGQPRSDDNRGHQSLYRWQVADNVPFQRSFEGCLEKYQPDDSTLYAATVCFYLEAGGDDAIPPTPLVGRGAFCGRPPFPETVLLPVRPNPCSGSAFLDYVLVEPSRVAVRVFDAQGRLVAVLSEANRNAGDHTIGWRGTDLAGRPVPSGRYFFRIEAGGRTVAAPLTLIR